MLLVWRGDRPLWDLCGVQCLQLPLLAKIVQIVSNAAGAEKGAPFLSVASLLCLPLLVQLMEALLVLKQQEQPPRAAAISLAEAAFCCTAAC